MEREQEKIMSKFMKALRYYFAQCFAMLGIFMLLFTSLGGQVLVAHAASGDNWPSYMHDLTHSGYNPTETAINPASASTLQPRWIDRVGGATGVTVSTQPVLANGLVYWGSWDGYEHATNPANPPKDVWTTYLGQTQYNPNCSPPHVGVASTATTASVKINGKQTSVLFVGGGDGTFYALNAITGTIIWSRSFGTSAQGFFLWSSPVDYQGSVYMGIASWGDCPLVQGEIVRMNDSNGALQNTWFSVPSGCIGGGVWSSISIDQATNLLYVGTGTTGDCSTTEPYAQALVVLTKNLSLVGSWQVPPAETVSDGDFGATPTLFTATIGGTLHNLVGLVNKNGIYYAFDRSNITTGPLWQTRLSTSPDNFTSSSWDGTHLYLAGNDTTLNGASCEGTLGMVNPTNGAFLWRDCLSGGKIEGTVTTVPGLAVVGVGSILYVVASISGQILFSYQDTSFHWFFAGPSISNGVMYAPNSDGNFYAFTPNGQ
jgi:outer membrane protein assembly factor BamB